MQPFSIDFITGQAGSSSQYTLQKHDHDQERQSQHQTESYYATPLLDDVYSIITQDAALSSMTTRLISTSEVHCREPTAEALERGTPSPNRDSGIDSDNSPVATQTTEIVAKTLRALEKKADAVRAKSSSSASKDKPPQSYVALIAVAILSSRDRKLSLADIYKHIIENHSYYNNEEKGWRNSIRYNLSINECFIKCGKEESGKGHFWGIHPQCTDDFAKGDYRRRQARRRAQRGMKIARNESIADNVPSTNIQPTPYIYTPMTPSVVAYHPYGPSGVQQSNQSAYGRYHASEMTHAYTGQQPMRLPVSHYATPMEYSNPSYSNAFSYQHAPYPGYIATPFGYMPQEYYSNAEARQHHSDRDSKDTNELEFETRDPKWLLPAKDQTTQSSPSSDDEIPYNNNIVIA